MIKAEAKTLADEIYQDVVGINVTQDRSHRLRIARLIATKVKKECNDAVWQYVINELNERLG